MIRSTDLDSLISYIFMATLAHNPSILQKMHYCTVQPNLQVYLDQLSLCIYQSVQAVPWNQHLRILIFANLGSTYTLSEAKNFLTKQQCCEISSISQPQTRKIWPARSRDNIQGRKHRIMILADDIYACKISAAAVQLVDVRL